MNHSILLNYFYSISKLKIAVFGDIMLDTYIFSDTHRISPEGPFPVYKYNDQKSYPGGAANVAINLRKMGADVTLFCFLGFDQNSKNIEKLLKNEGIKIISVRDRSIETINKIRLYSNEIQITRLDIENKNISDYDFHAKKLYKRLDSSFDGLIFSDYGKGAISNPKELINISRKNRIKIFIDPKANDFKKYKNSYFISPNLKEFCNIVGQVSNDKDIVNKGRALLKSININYLLITLGSKGSILLDRNKNVIRSEGYKTNSREVIGAGDTAISHFTLSDLAGLDLKMSCEISNLAASTSVSKKFTAYVDPSDILNNKSYIYGKNIEKKHLKSLKNIYSEKKSIVFTNGCFDVIHAGHINLLKFCKEIGEIVVVGINTDNSIKKLKGNHRPVNNLQNRIAVLKELNCIDFIVTFDELTPINLIKELNPNMIVKGSDYKKNNVVGYDYIKKKGGKVVIYRIRDNLSSSLIIKSTQ